MPGEAGFEREAHAPVDAISTASAAAPPGDAWDEGLSSRSVCFVIALQSLT
jgi:hypothetical protein